MSGDNVLTVDNLSRDFLVAGKTLKAVDGVSFSLARGETLGIVGESGCGKSTLARLILRLIKPTAGHISLMGEEVSAMPERQFRQRRSVMQAVFQDPVSSLNPRLTVGDIVSEPLWNRGLSSQERQRRVADMLALVGLPVDAASRFPHAFSGGQRQRIAIARALIAEPSLLICDEATSALDVSVQAQILNLIADLQARFALAVVFVSHNLSVVRHISSHVAVMYLGRVVEYGSEARIFEQPAHPYTRALLAAVPEPDIDAPVEPPLAGEIPSALARPSGCHFHPRCPRAKPECAASDPPVIKLADGHEVRCFFPHQT